MPYLSRTEIIGHLGKDPEIRHLGNGSAVASFSVATTDKWKDKASGEDKERTEWHRCVVWGKQATNAAEWLSKGSLVYVEGQNETRKWEDNDGNTRYTTEIKVRRFMPLQKAGSKPQNKPPIEDDIPF